LDDFFKDESIEGAECDICRQKKKYQKCVPVVFPGTIVLTLERYRVTKWDTIEKDRRTISTDKLLNFKNYTTGRTDILYKLESIVIHKGQQPTVGHYTTLQTTTDNFIQIDDDNVQTYTENTLDKDGYLLLYSAMKISHPISIYMCCCAIANSAICTSLERSLSDRCFVSPYKRQILDRLKAFQFSTNEMPDDGKLLYLIQRSVDPVPNVIDIVSEVVRYVTDPYPAHARGILGIDVIQHFQCSDCKNQYGQTMHLLFPDQRRPKSEKYPSPKAICTCKGTLSVKELISKVGDTILLQYIPETIVGLPCLKFNFADAIGESVGRIQMDFRVSVCFLPEEPSIIVISDNTYKLVDACEEITNITEEEFYLLTVGKKVVLFCDKINEGMNKIEKPRRVPVDSLPSMFGFTVLETLRPDLDCQRAKMMESFPCGLSNSKHHLDTAQVDIFLDGWFTDLHVDFYTSSLASTLESKGLIALPCSWFQHGMEDFISKSTFHEWMSHLVAIPLNQENCHWVLMVIGMEQKYIAYIDPMGGYNESAVLKLLHYLNLQFFFHTGKQMISREWIIKRAAATASFPKQNDRDSCGAYICLYIEMLSRCAVLEPMGNEQDISIRRLILSRLLEETFFGQPQPFGLKELFLYRELDALVFSIATSDHTSEGRNLERHKFFLKDPTYFSKQYLIKFGDDYFTAQTIDDAIMYVHRRYFVANTKLFQHKVIMKDLPRETKLYTILSTNWCHATSYIRDVLVKEILIEILAEHLAVDYDVANNICVETEISFLQAKRKQVIRV
jgi:hypothetical protein